MAAVSLGDVTFGLGADTKGLNKSIRTLNEFGKKIDSIARKQSDSANKTVAQMSKQESAVRKALQQVLRLNQQIRQSGAPPELIARNTAAFGKLTRGLTATNLTFKDQLRVQDRFGAQLGKSSRALNAFKTDKARKSLKGMSTVMRDLESASVLAVGPLSGLGARIRAVGAIANRSTLLITGLLAGVTLLGVAFFKLTAAAIRARTEMDRINSVMMQATGSAFFARKEFEFVAELADRMGQQVAVTAQSFAEFAAAARDTALEGQGVRDVFTGVLEAVTALKLPLETQKGLFRALIQMMSKGVIQSEELRGQFGERLAGGFELVRKEVGATRTEFAKMLKTGALFAEKFVPAIGRAMHKSFEVQAANAANTLVNAMNRLSNATLFFNLAFDRLINASGIGIGIINSLTSVIADMAKNLDTIAAAAGAAAVGLAVLAGPAIIKGIFAVGRGIKTLTLFMMGLNVAMNANPAVFLATVLTRLAIAIGAATGAFVLFEALMNDSEEATKNFNRELEELLALEQLRTDLQVEQTRTFVESARTRLKALEEEAQTTKKLMDFFPDDIEFSFFGESLSGVEGQIRVLQDGIAKLDALVAKGASSAGELGDEISDALQDAIDEVEDFAKALERAEIQIASLGQKGADTPAFLDALFEAQDLIEDLSTSELDALNEKLAELGITGMEPVEALRQLIFQAELAEDQWKDMLKVWEKSPEILQDVTRDLDVMAREFAAMGEGVQAFEALQEQLDKEDAVTAYAEELAKMSDSFRAMVPTVQEFADSLDAFADKQKAFENLKDITKDLESAVESSFSTISSSIVDGIKTGELTMESFIGTLENVLAALLEAVIQMLIIQPLMASLKGGLGSLAGGIAGGGGGSGGSFFGGLFSKKGNVFNNGMVKKFAKGTVLDGPTILPLANGSTGIGGEAGPEGVLPLARTNTGDLGVKVADGGSGPMFTVNLNFPPGTDVQQFRESMNQVGHTIAGIIGVASASNG